MKTETNFNIVERQARVISEIQERLFNRLKYGFSDDYDENVSDLTMSLTNAIASYEVLVALQGNSK